MAGARPKRSPPFSPASVRRSSLPRPCRFLDTAAPIALACGLSVQVEPQLHERRVGLLSGTPTAGTDGVWPETLGRWIDGDTAFAPAGAESFEDIRDRVVPIWQRLTTTFDGQTIVVVAHGVVNKVLLLSLLREYSVADWQRLGPSRNVAVNELVCDADGWRPVRLNELPLEVAAATEEWNPS